MFLFLVKDGAPSAELFRVDFRAERDAVAGASKPDGFMNPPGAVEASCLGTERGSTPEGKDSGGRLPALSRISSWTDFSFVTLAGLVFDLACSGALNPDIAVNLFAPRCASAVSSSNRAGSGSGSTCARRRSGTRVF